MTRISLETIHANQLLIISMLKQILQQENTMTVSLSAITAEVTNNTTVTGSVVKLIQNLAAQIAAIPPSTDPTTQAALDALTQTLSTNDQTIAGAVVANTPTPVASPSVAKP